MNNRETDKYLSRYEKIVLSRGEASDILASERWFGFWVKWVWYKFYDMSEVATQQLFGMRSEDIIWYSDFELWNKNRTEKMDEKQFARVCRASDRYVEKTKIKGDDRPYIFIELLETHGHELQIWQTTKIVNDKWQFPSVYTSLTETIWNEKAKNLIKILLENKIIEEINSNLYVYIN